MYFIQKKIEFQEYQVLFENYVICLERSNHASVAFSLEAYNIRYSLVSIGAFACMSRRHVQTSSLLLIRARFAPGVKRSAGRYYVCSAMRDVDDVLGWVFWLGFWGLMCSVVL
jgi:hypothetical protein